MCVCVCIVNSPLSEKLCICLETVANPNIWKYSPSMLHSSLKVVQVLLHNNPLICVFLAIFQYRGTSPVLHNTFKIFICFKRVHKISKFGLLHNYICGLGSSVGIATDCGLDSLGSNPGGDETFRPSRWALGPILLPVQWYRVYPRGKVWLGRATDHSHPSSATVMEE